MADFLRLKAPVHCRRRRRRHCRDSARTHGGSDRCPLSSWTPHKRGRQARSSKGHACPAPLTARGCRKRDARPGVSPSGPGLAGMAWARVTRSMARRRYDFCLGEMFALCLLLSWTASSFGAAFISCSSVADLLIGG